MDTPPRRGRAAPSPLVVSGLRRRSRDAADAGAGLGRDGGDYSTRKHMYAVAQALLALHTACFGRPRGASPPLAAFAASLRLARIARLLDTRLTLRAAVDVIKRVLPEHDARRGFQGPAGPLPCTAVTYDQLCRLVREWACVKYPHLGAEAAMARVLRRHIIPCVPQCAGQFPYLQDLCSPGVTRELLRGEATLQAVFEWAVDSTMPHQAARPGSPGSDHGGSAVYHTAAKGAVSLRALIRVLYEHVGASAQALPPAQVSALAAVVADAAAPLPLQAVADTLALASFVAFGAGTGDRPANAGLVPPAARVRAMLVRLEVLVKKAADAAAPSASRRNDVAAASVFVVRKRDGTAAAASKRDGTAAAASNGGLGLSNGRGASTPHQHHNGTRSRNPSPRHTPRTDPHTATPRRRPRAPMPTPAVKAPSATDARVRTRAATEGSDDDGSLSVIEAFDMPNGGERDAPARPVRAEHAVPRERQAAVHHDSPARSTRADSMKQSSRSTPMSLEQMFALRARGDPARQGGVPVWRVADFVVFCRECDMLCNQLTHADAVNVFSLATVGEADVLGWQRFRSVALPELAALLFPDAPTPQVAVVMLEQQHVHAALESEASCPPDVRPLLESMEALSLLQQQAVPLQYLFVLYAKQHSALPHALATTWQAELADKSSIGVRLGLESFLDMLADFGVAMASADSAVSRVMPRHVAMSLVTPLASWQDDEAGFSYPAFCEALYVIAQAQYVGSGRGDSSRDQHRAVVVLQHLFRSLDASGAVFKYASHGFSVGAVSIGGGVEDGGASGDDQGRAPRAGMGSALSLARHTHESARAAEAHVTHTLMEVFAVLVSDDDDARAKPRRDHVSRPAFAAFVRACGLVTGRLTQCAANTVFDATSFAVCGDTTAGSALLAADGDAGGSADGDSSHVTSSSLWNVLPSAGLRPDAFVTAVLSCARIALPGEPPHDAVRRIVTGFLANLGPALSGSVVSEAALVRAEQRVGVDAGSGRQLQWLLFSPHVLGVSGQHEQVLGRLFCMFASRPADVGVAGSGATGLPASSAPRRIVADDGADGSVDALATHAMGLVATVQFLQCAGVCPGLVPVAAVLSMYRRCLQPPRSLRQRGRGGEHLVTRPDRAIPTGTALSFAGFVEFVTRCLLRLSARDTLALLCRRRDPALSHGQVLGRLATFGVKSAATKLNSLLSVLCCRVEAHVDAIEERVQAARAATRALPPSPPAASPTRASHPSTPPHGFGRVSRAGEAEAAAIVGDEDLRDLFLSRCRTVAPAGRVWTTATMVSFCDDLGVVEPSPSGRGSRQLRSHIVATTGLPPASPIPVSVVETLVDACAAEARGDDCQSPRHGQVRGSAAPSHLSLAEVMSVLGDVASLVFVEYPRPGAMFRRYIAAVLQASESPTRGRSPAEPRPSMQSPWSATETDHSNEVSSPASMPGKGTSAHGGGRGGSGAPGGLRLAPRVGLPVLHEVALLHVYERYAAHQPSAVLTAHSRGQPSTGERTSTVADERFRDPAARMPCENALHFLRDFGLLSTNLPHDVAKDLAAQLPSTELVSSGDTHDDVGARSQVERLTFVAFVQFLQRCADVAFNADGSGRANDSTPASCLSPWGRLWHLLQAANSDTDTLFRREPCVPYPASPDTGPASHVQAPPRTLPSLGQLLGSTSGLGGEHTRPHHAATLNGLASRAPAANTSASRALRGGSPGHPRPSPVEDMDKSITLPDLSMGDVRADDLRAPAAASNGAAVAPSWDAAGSGAEGAWARARVGNGAAAPRREQAGAGAGAGAGARADAASGAKARARDAARHGPVSHSDRRVDSASGPSGAHPPDDRTTQTEGRDMSRATGAPDRSVPAQAVSDGSVARPASRHPRAARDTTQAVGDNDGRGGGAGVGGGSLQELPPAMALVLSQRWVALQLLWRRAAAPEAERGVAGVGDSMRVGDGGLAQGAGSVVTLGALCHTLVAARVTPDVIAPAAIRVAFGHFSEPSPFSVLPVEVRDSVVTSELALACVMCDAAARTQAQAAGSDTSSAAAATLDKALALVGTALVTALPVALAAPSGLSVGAAGTTAAARQSPTHPAEAVASVLIEEVDATDRAAQGLPPPVGGFSGLPAILPAAPGTAASGTPAVPSAKAAGAGGDARVFAELMNPDVVTLFAQWRPALAASMRLAAARTRVGDLAPGADPARLHEDGAAFVLAASGVSQGWNIGEPAVRSAFRATAMGGGWKALSTPAGSHTGDASLTVGVSECEELLLRLALQVLGQHKDQARPADLSVAVVLSYFLASIAQLRA